MRLSDSGLAPAPVRVFMASTPHPLPYAPAGETNLEMHLHSSINVCPDTLVMTCKTHLERD